MLSIKKVFCVSLLHYFVCGNIIRNQLSNYFDITSAPQQLPASTPLSKECGPNKSLNSRNDITVIIDYIYNETSFDQKIKQNYQSKAVAIRDKHLQDLNDFTAWLDNQPKHLKEILLRLETIRKVQVEPVVEIASDVLNEYPKLEMSYNKKNDTANKLINKLKRYDRICKLKCEDQQVKGHNITKRHVKDDFYCSSLQDLHKEITEKLSKSIEKSNNETLEILSVDDKKYKQKIDEIKSKLKNNALKEFDRTVYDILSLQYEYHRFMNDIASKDLHKAVYDIKSLGLQADAKLLQLEQFIENFGKYCNNCTSKTLVRNARKADLESELKTTKDSPNLVDQLIDIKIKEIKGEVESDLINIFNELDKLIEKNEVETHNREKLKPIQEEINRMTKGEKEALSKLKNRASPEVIKKIMELIKKLKDLLKLIEDIIHNLKFYNLSKNV